MLRVRTIDRPTHLARRRRPGRVSGLQNPARRGVPSFPILKGLWCETERRGDSTYMATRNTNDDEVLLAREKNRLLSSPENSHLSSHTSCSINRLDLIADLI
jgi:hypothetical protein